MADTVANGAVSFVLLVSCFCNEVSPRVTKCHRRRRAGTAPIKKPKAPGQHAGCTVALKPFQSGALRREHSALRFDAGDNPIVAALGQLKANAVTLVKSGDIQTGVYRR